MTTMNTKTNYENKTFKKKIEEVQEQLRALKRVLVAFSGGKDSFFLLKIAVETLGKENVTACHVKTGFSTRNDQKRINYFSQLLDFQMEVIEIDLSGEKFIMSNPRERCYFCKKKIFSTLKKKAQELGMETVLDGTTYSDLSEYRPGLKALEELNILSLLQDAGLTSDEIAAYLKKNAGIEEYFLTSSTCLATRFPYDMQLDERLLNIFDELEEYFVNRGIYPVKIRYIPDGIRIETPSQHFREVLENRDKIIDFCKKAGLKFVTLDLEGIKSGVWD
jgi:pyridinium-3,5-biscarboxylic acid mononucleotide sulfurtransferase